MLKVLLYVLSISFFLFSALDVTANNIRQTITTESAVFEYLKSNDETYYSIKQVQQFESSQWVSEQDFKNTGEASKDHWLRIRVSINSNTVTPLFLEIDNPFINDISIYLYRGVKSRRYVAGHSVSALQQSIALPTLSFPLPNSESKLLDIYINYKNEVSSPLSLAITDHRENIEKVKTQSFFIGMVIGLTAILLLVTLAIYRDRKSLILQHYFGFLSFGCITVLSIEGVTSNILWSSLPWLQNLLIPSLLLLTLWHSIGLIKALIINEVTDYPLIELTFKWIPRLILIISLILLILPNVTATTISIAVLCVSAISISTVLITFIIKSKKTHAWLLTAWLIFIVTLTLKAINFIGLISFPSMLITIVTASYILQFLLWGSIILNDYISKKAHKNEENNQLINELQIQNQETNNSLIQHHQEHLDLEAIINERTFELNVTLRELQETNLQLQEQATNDALTGVKNRKFFDQRLIAEYRLSRRQHTPIALLLLDVDKFKLVNDNYGHLTGDKVLIEICNIASKMLKRPNDYVCRYGGEEFAILLSHTDEKGAVKVAQTIRQKIESSTIKTTNESLQVTVSIGVSVLMIDKATPETLLFEQADKALYFAKESGRNNVKSYNEFQLSHK